MIVEQSEAVEGICCSGEKGGSGTRAMAWEGERSGAGGQTHWAGGDENKIVVRIKIHGIAGMRRETGLGQADKRCRRTFTTTTTRTISRLTTPVWPCLVRLPRPAGASGRQNAAHAQEASANIAFASVHEKTASRRWQHICPGRAQQCSQIGEHGECAQRTCGESALRSVVLPDE